MVSYEHEAGGPHHREWLVPTVLKLAVAALILAGAWAVYTQIGTDDRVKKRMAERITIINQPTPRKPEQRPEEQEVVKEEVRIEQLVTARPQQANAPEDNRLGVDEAGGASGDSFGLAAKKGGLDITMLGSNDKAGAGFTGFSAYAGVLQQHLQSELSRHERIRRGAYQVKLKLWIADDGLIRRHQMLGSTGDAALDQDIELALDNLPAIHPPPSADIPQPVLILLRVREAL